MNPIIRNMETGKIELHFDKSEYTALTEEQKSSLKSAFLWSNYGKCWVSRAKEPNTYNAERVAEKLGFSGIEKQGERLSFAEQVERKAERAERRAERYEEYAENAERRAVNYQAPLNKMRGDIAFFTQPIIAGHAGSQAFARCRERMYRKYERGMEEYKKSEYFQSRAESARSNAENAKYSNAVYLDSRIRECNKNLRDYQKLIVSLEEKIYKIQQGETLKNYSGEEITIEMLDERMEEVLDRYEAEQDKLDYMEDCLSKIGGVKFSQENIKVGYIVEVQRWGKCEIVGAGSMNVQIKTGNSVLTESYAAIIKIIAASKAPEIKNPFVVGDILTLNSFANDSIYRAFQVLKTTEKSIQIQEIKIENHIPQAGQFKSGSKPEQKRIIKSKYSDYIGAYYDDWQLNKYVIKE